MLFNNSNKPLYDLRGQTVSTWGKDTTGSVKYTINNQGFRSSIDYAWSPKYAFFGSSSIFGIGVSEEQTLVAQFNQAQNYGLAGNYLNQDSVVNLENFLNSSIYNDSIKIVFFWIERPGQENIQELISYINSFNKGVINISQGNKYLQAINLMPHIDRDISGTHPGPKTHLMWAKTIRLLLDRA